MPSGNRVVSNIWCRWKTSNNRRCDSQLARTPSQRVRLESTRYFRIPTIVLITGLRRYLRLRLGKSLLCGKEPLDENCRVVGVLFWEEVATLHRLTLNFWSPLPPNT